MNNTIYITGHKNPDTDSICSSMAYANLLQLQGKNAIACRLGPLNEESKFVTKYFNIEGPLLIKDARSQLRDIEIDEPIIINKDCIVKDAWNNILGSKNRSLMVTDNKGQLQGVISTSNLSMIRLLQEDELEDLMKQTTLENIAKSIDGTICYNPNEFNINGKITIIHNDNKLIDEELNNTIGLTVYDKQLQQQAIKHGVKCLIVANNVDIDNETILVAKNYNCAIIKTNNNIINTLKFIQESYPIHLLMTKTLVTFKDDEYVNDALKKMSQSRFRSYPVLNDDGHIVGQVSRYHLAQYKKKQFILVDHSSINQCIDNIDQAQILEIIDHHHIGNIQTNYPVDYRNKICGCTGSIVNLLYKERGYTPDAKVAGLLLSAIISDTLFFKSKTTTQFDIDTANELAKLANVDIDVYAKDLLGASADIKDADLSVILKRDLKEYEIGKYKVAVGQTNYKDVEDIQTIRDEFRVLLVEELNKKEYDLIIMMFTDVTANGTVFEFDGPLSHIMDNIISTMFNDKSGYDKEIISRKQQLIPKMGEIIREL